MWGARTSPLGMQPAAPPPGGSSPGGCRTICYFPGEGGWGKHLLAWEMAGVIPEAQADPLLD